MIWCLNEDGEPCHIQAKRGAKTGTQGKANAHERAKLPKLLCREVLKAVIARMEEKNRKLAT